MRFAAAYSPSGLSGLFSAYTEPSDPYKKGALGAGLALEKGVRVEVWVEESEKQDLECYLNGQKAKLGLVEKLQAKIREKGGVEGSYKIIVKQHVSAPIGGGLGTSGASALATALALGKALGAKMNYQDLAREAHVAEIEEGTGLGTVSGLVVGGAVAVARPGAPGTDMVVRLLADPSVKVVVGFFSPINKREALSRAGIERVNELGRRLLDRLLEEPTLERFMFYSRRFAEEAGFMTERLKKAFTKVEQAGAVGVSQAMIGETVYSIAYDDNVEKVVDALKSLGAITLVSGIEWRPAGLL
ncbi:MAG: hypothetical protein N3E41_06125 [Thermofilaceae archaeon]|nr:hypothetical protein [Thermofilaceae archaeon]